MTQYHTTFPSLAFLSGSNCWHRCRKDNTVISVFLRVATTHNTGETVSWSINLVYNEDMEADRNAERLPVWQDRQTAFPSREISCPVADKIA